MPNIQELIGKVCTITTVEVNFRFKPEQMMDYFMGTLEAVDDEFFWLRHPQTNCTTVIARKYIVSIAEEQVLYEENPDHAKIIEEYRKEKPVTAARTSISQPSPFVDPTPPEPSPFVDPTPPEPSPFVDPTALTNLSKKVKQSLKR